MKSHIFTSKLAHFVRNCLLDGVISYCSSEKDAKLAATENLNLNGITKLLPLTAAYSHCLLGDEDSLHKFKAAFHNSL